MHFSKLFKHCPVCGSVHFTDNNVKSKRCDKCGFVYYMNASAAVAAFILNEKQELLVCVRGREPAKGTWDLPGGFIDDNETAEQAVQREILEELNLEIQSVKYIFSLPNIYEYSGLTIPTLDMFFLTEVKDFGQLRAADDVSECMFVAINKLHPEKFGKKKKKNAVKLFTENKF